MSLRAQFYDLSLTVKGFSDIRKSLEHYVQEVHRGWPTAVCSWT